ncbi:MAG: T9SS type A sorting domain-containing protein [Kordia sp.]|uniref:T9SS type A sorting domain-containing protein n=1 Tax=Kordia sp. TaxID=1965332 RepID=UPI00385A66A3
MKTKLLIACLFVFSFVSAQIPTDETMRYLFTNGSIVNEANPGIGDLTQSGSGVTQEADRDALANNAMKLNGVQYNGGQTPASNLTDFALSFWIKSPNVAGANRALVQMYGAGGRGFRLTQSTDGNSGLLKFVARGENTTNGFNVDINTQELVNHYFDGGWHHVLITGELNVTNNNLGINFYLDGELLTSMSGTMIASGTVPAFFNGATLVIAPTTTKYLNYIDDVRFYERSLTTGEIDALATEYTEKRTYVNVNATGANDGTTWANAYTDVSTALDNFTFGDIWVAQGIYIPGTSRNDSFKIPSGAKIYGGFQGTETDLSDRDIDLYPTIFSGDVNQDDTGVDFSGFNRTENVYHVVEVLGNKVRLDGLTITSGQADASTGENAVGGGIFVDREVTELYVDKCIVQKNAAVNGGAGVMNLNMMTLNSLMEFTNTRFQENVSRHGSSIYARANYTKWVRLNIINCIFDGDQVKDNGSSLGLAGVVWLRSITYGARFNTKVINSTFANNQLTATGAITERAVLGVSKYRGIDMRIEVSNSIFYNNTSNTSTAPLSLGRINSDPVPNIRKVYNSIGEDNFSNIAATDKVAVSDSDPLFTDATNSDFTIQMGSPAIDSGDNTKVPVEITEDFLGNQRIFNSDVDMGVYEFGSSTLGVQEVYKLVSFVIYPNPVKNQLNIHIEGEIKNIEVYNYTGQKVIQTTKGQIDTSNLASGMYILKLYKENGEVGVKRFLKQ